MTSYIFLAVIKVLDNIISTAKSIATYKEQKILSSVFVVLSQLIFYMVIDQVIEDNTILVIIIVAVSSGIGNYIAFAINDKFKRDSKWMVVLTTSCKEDVKLLCNYLARHSIRYVASDGYDKQGNPTINVIAFSKTKEESSKIDAFLEVTNHKYLVEILK